MTSLIKWQKVIVAIFAVSALGCKDESPTAPPATPVRELPTPSEVHALALAASENVLSAHIAFTNTTAPDLVRVSLWDSSGEVFTTPFRRGKAGADTIDVLDLNP